MPEEFKHLKYLDATGQYSAPDSVLMPIEIPSESDLNDYNSDELIDRYYYCSDGQTIKNIPIKEKKKDPKITEFYFKSYTIIPQLVCGQMLVENNNIWVRNGLEGVYSDWEMIYHTGNFEAMPAGEGGNSELDDLTIKTGKFKNKGAGWNTYTFPIYHFDEVPQIFCNCNEYEVDTKNVTKDGFDYRVFSYSGSSKSDVSDTNLEIQWFAIEYGGD